MTSITQKIAFLAAGGTGGHLFPAQALAEELSQRRWRIYLATDERTNDFIQNFPAERIYHFKSATLKFENPVRVIKSLFKIMRGVNEAWEVLRKVKPDVIVGFGGYPSLPPVLASVLCRIPSLIHEQNACMGRANRLLSHFVQETAFGFSPVGQNAKKGKTVTGNPVRASVLAASQIPYNSFNSEKVFRLLVFGGSQGARFFSEILPQALSFLSCEQRNTLDIVQQVRPGEEEALKRAYSELGVKATISSFFLDLPERIADAHLIISRSGASTVSEISVIGRPSVLVPYPYALDHDQRENAHFLTHAGAAEMYLQSFLKPEFLAERIAYFLFSPEKLSAMASAAKTVGKPNAAEVLADLTESLAAQKPSNSFDYRLSL